MRKSSSKLTSLFLALVMVVSLVVVPTATASEQNEITGLIWDVNSITGIKLANSAIDTANMQAMLAVYEGDELANLVTADVTEGSKIVSFASATALTTGQSAKALLWNTADNAVDPLAVNYPITADGEAYSSCEVKGVSKIVLPGEGADFRTKNVYSLFDSELDENVKATFTISGNVAGLTMFADGTLIASPEANVGTISVNALYGCKTYTKEVNLVKGLYEDFESYDLGTMSATDGWDNSRLGTICSDAQGKYLDASTNTQAIYSFDDDLSCENLTFELDVYVTSDKKTLFQIKGAGNDAQSATNYYIDYWFNSSMWLRTKYVEDGSTVNYRNLIQFATDTWTKIKMQLNLVDNSYTVWVGSDKIIDNWKLNSTYATYVFNALILKGYTDNINVYSGEAYDAYELNGYDTIVLPGDNANFATSIAYSLVDVDTGAAANSATFAISGDTAGLSIDANGNLIATNAAQAGTITVSATKNGKTYTKDITAIKGYSADFEDDTVGELPEGWAANRNTTVIATGDGNKYIERTEGYAAYGLDSKYQGESVTLEFDTLLYKSVTNETLPYFMSRLNDSDVSEQYYFIGLRDVKQGDVVTEIGLHTNYFDEDGNSISDRNFIKYVPNNGGSFTTKYVINFVDGTYDLYIDNELILDDYSFPNVGSDYGLETIRFRTCIDNVHIYTGTKN